MPSHFILTTPPVRWVQQVLSASFQDEDTEAKERLSDLPKITEQGQIKFSDSLSSTLPTVITAHSYEL